MDVNGVGSEGLNNIDHYAKSGKEAKAATSNKDGLNSKAAVYEKSNSKEGELRANETNSDTVKRLMADSEKRATQMRQLVDSMLSKQGKVANSASDFYRMLRNGEVDVDPATRAQAQKDIAEDGYWGVEQTSDRLVSFAMAVSGDDPAMADKMIKAVQKGFKQATKAWGDELPDISQRTLKATMEKLESWRDSIKGAPED